MHVKFWENGTIFNLELFRSISVISVIAVIMYKMYIVDKYECDKEVMVYKVYNYPSKK